MEAVANEILWVDDQIEGYRPYIQALEEHGCRVSAASSAAAGLELCSQMQFKAILADIRMGPPNGIEFLRRVVSIQKTRLLGVFSSYLYLDMYRRELRGLDFKVELIDKDFPTVGTEDFEERFVAPIRTLLERGVTQTITAQDEKLSRATGENPFAMELTDFQKKSIVEKDQIILRAREAAAATIEHAFKEGKQWVMLCGTKDVIRRSAASLEEIPPEKEIAEFAENQRRVAFQFVNSLGSEDLWSLCASETNLRNYPTVKLGIGGRDFDVHFDTGSPVTLFSYEDIRAMLPVGVGQATILVQLNGRPCYAARLDVEALLQCQAGGLSEYVRLKGLALRDWLEGPFARFCTPACNPPDASPPGELCRFRKGLVGRNLLNENGGIVLVLDGQRRKTILAERGVASGLAKEPAAGPRNREEEP